MDARGLDEAALTAGELARYSRHLALPDVGLDGQRRLKAARVLVVGVGGLGSPVSLYLAAAGTGTIGLVDFDEVEETNLQRQILYATSDVGRPKLEAAAERLQDLNPHVSIVSHRQPFGSANALELVRGYDIVVDGTDNFATRYLVNDACVLARRPNVYGSIHQFEGQASVFAATGGPCYRCLHPEPPEPGLIPNCAEGGVLGVLPAVVGSIQATEALKLILGIGEPLVGRFLVYDALRMRVRELTLRRDPACPVCGDTPTITELVDTGLSCAAPVAEQDAQTMTAKQLSERLERGEAVTLLDVREPHELHVCRIAGAVNIPLGQLRARAVELDGRRPLVAFCRSGARSAQAVAVLRELGFADCRNLHGGILSWIDQVDPTQKKY